MCGLLVGLKSDLQEPQAACRTNSDLHQLELRLYR